MTVHSILMLIDEYVDCSTGGDGSFVTFHTFLDSVVQNGTQFLYL